jgi:hypothetical protein
MSLASLQSAQAIVISAPMMPPSVLHAMLVNVRQDMARMEMVNVEVGGWKMKKNFLNTFNLHVIKNIPEIGTSMCGEEIGIL